MGTADFIHIMKSGVCHHRYSGSHKLNFVGTMEPPNEPNQYPQGFQLFVGRQPISSGCIITFSIKKLTLLLIATGMCMHVACMCMVVFYSRCTSYMKRFPTGKQSTRCVDGQKSRSGGTVGAWVRTQDEEQSSNIKPWRSVTLASDHPHNHIISFHNVAHQVNMLCFHDECILCSGLRT